MQVLSNLIFTMNDKFKVNWCNEHCICYQLDKLFGNVFMKSQSIGSLSPPSLSPSLHLCLSLYLPLPLEMGLYISVDTITIMHQAAIACRLPD